MDTKESADALPEALLTFDWSEFATASRGVVFAVAAASGSRPVDLDPIANVLDPDSLDDAVAADGSERPGADVRVEFEYDRYRIVVEGGGRGYVYDTVADAPG